MTRPRAALVSLDDTPWYHCVTRCVRRALGMGIDERREKAQAAIPQKAREYVYYPETFEPLALIEGVGSTRYLYHYHNDPSGCPTKVTNVNGEVSWAASYTAWGQVSKSHVNVVDNLFRLQGQYEDDETGLRFNRHRYYESHIGQFISQDPAGLDPGENIYEFGVSILGWVDPLGLMCAKGDFKRLRRSGFAET